METINTNCYGISISHDPDNKAPATIVSSMKEMDTHENKAFNSAVDGLEAIILAHHCAGIDITAPAYLEGIETAYEAIGNNIQEDTPNNDVATIQKERQVNANATETIYYEVSRADWDSALEKHGSEEIALYELQRDLKVTISSHEVDVDEVEEEFNVMVIEV